MSELTSKHIIVTPHDGEIVDVAIMFKDEEITSIRLTAQESRDFALCLLAATGLLLELDT